MSGQNFGRPDMMSVENVCVILWPVNVYKLKESRFIWLLQRYF